MCLTGPYSADCADADLIVKGGCCAAFRMPMLTTAPAISRILHYPVILEAVTICRCLTAASPSFRTAMQVALKRCFSACCTAGRWLTRKLLRLQLQQ